MARRSEDTSLADPPQARQRAWAFPCAARGRHADPPSRSQFASTSADTFPDARLWPAEPLQRAGARARSAPRWSAASPQCVPASRAICSAARPRSNRARRPAPTSSACSRSEREARGIGWAVPVRRFTIADAMYFPGADALSNLRRRSAALARRIDAEALEAHPSPRARWSPGCPRRRPASPSTTTTCAASAGIPTPGCTQKMRPRSCAAPSKRDRARRPSLAFGSAVRSLASRLSTRHRST